MPKPTTGRVTRAAEPPSQQLSAKELDDRNVAILMTAVFTGIALLVATIVLAAVGTLGMDVLNRLADGPLTAEVGFAIGLALAMVVIAVLLRRFAAPIRRRSPNLYRGAWIGTIGALIVIVFMAYLPQVAFPQYCPPGAICQSSGTR